MSVTVIAHDTRLEGRTPAASSSTFTFEVDEDTSLDDFFDRCRFIAGENGGISTLYIMAHGREMEFAGERGGGFGIMFCREQILLDNVSRFAQLADKVGAIVLLLCTSAEVSPDILRVDAAHPELAETFHGDGNELCLQMAVGAQCPVTANRQSQAYVTPGDSTQTFDGFELYEIPGNIEFGDWEGTVVTYDKHGNIIDEWTSPPAWRDELGGLHDPRVDPPPM